MARTINWYLYDRDTGKPLVGVRGEAFNTTTTDSVIATSNTAGLLSFTVDSDALYRAVAYVPGDIRVHDERDGVFLMSGADIHGNAHITGNVNVDGVIIGTFQSGGNITMPDDSWIGLGANSGRIRFQLDAPDVAAFIGLDITMEANKTVDGVDVGSHAHTGAAGQGVQIAHSSLSGISANDHHNAVTVGAGGLSSHLGLSTQELTLSAINHSELSNIGANDHHNAVTIGAGGLSAHLQLATQALTLTAINHSELSNIGANDHHNQQHDIVSGDHTLTGAAMSIVGATALNTLGLLTPSSNPGADTSAILKTDTSGYLQLAGLGIGVANAADNYLTMADAGGAKNENYTSGWTGSGYSMTENLLEVQNLSVRGRFNAYELLIHQIRATNGSIFVANTGKAKTVTAGVAPYYTIETETEHGFAVNDLIRAQRVSPAGSAYLCEMIVTAVGSPTEFTAGDVGADAPVAGYEFVRIGNITDTDRQGSIYLTADDTTGAPYINILAGVTSFADWTDSSKLKTRIGSMYGAFGAGDNHYFGAGFGDFDSGNYMRYWDGPGEDAGFKLSAGGGAVSIDANGINIAEPTTYGARNSITFSSATASSVIYSVNDPTGDFKHLLVIQANKPTSNPDNVGVYLRAYGTASKITQTVMYVEDDGMPTSWASVAATTNNGVGSVSLGPAVCISHTAFAPAGMLHIMTDQAANDFIMDVYSDTQLAGITGRRAKGTLDIPSAVTADLCLFGVYARGRGATGFSNTERSSIRFWASENWTDAAQGSYITFEATPTGGTSTAEKARIAGDGTMTLAGGLNVNTTGAGAGDIAQSGSHILDTAAPTLSKHFEACGSFTYTADNQSRKVILLTNPDTTSSSGAIYGTVTVVLSGMETGFSNPIIGARKYYVYARDWYSGAGYNMVTEIVLEGVAPAGNAYLTLSQHSVSPSQAILKLNVNQGAGVFRNPTIVTVHYEFTSAACEAGNFITPSFGDGSTV